MQSFTSTSTCDCKAGSKLSNSVSMEWDSGNGFKLDKLEFNPSDEGSFTTEASLTGFMDGLKVDFKGNDSDKCDITAQYTHEHATVSATVDGSDFKSYSGSVSTGINDVKVGGSADFKGGKASFAAAASYTMPKMFFGVNLTNTFADIKGLFSFKVDKDLTLAATTTYGTAKKNLGFNVGAVYKCNKDTTLKAKFDNDKNINLSVKQAVNAGLTVTGWTKVADLSPKSAAYGAKVVIG